LYMIWLREFNEKKLNNYSPLNSMRIFRRKDFLSNDLYTA
jgi:hypothetical protein